MRSRVSLRVEHQRAVLVVRVPVLLLGDALAHPLELERRLGDVQRAALLEAAVDALARAPRRRPRRRSSRMARIWAFSASRPARSAKVAGEPASSPSTQPPLRPEAPKPATSASSTTTSTDGIGAAQLERGPEAGEAGADDAHVGLAGAGERRARDGRRVQLGEPMRDGHARDRMPAMSAHADGAVLGATVHTLDDGAPGGHRGGLARRRRDRGRRRRRGARARRPGHGRDRRRGRDRRPRPRRHPHPSVLRHAADPRRGPAGGAHAGRAALDCSPPSAPAAGRTRGCSATACATSRSTSRASAPTRSPSAVGESPVFIGFYDGHTGARERAGARAGRASTGRASSPSTPRSSAIPTGARPARCSRTARWTSSAPPCRSGRTRSSWTRSPPPSARSTPSG